MEIKPKFQFVEGSFDTQRVKLLCIPDDNHGRVDLCIKDPDCGWNIPIGQIKLFSRDLYRDFKETLPDAETRSPAGTPDRDIHRQRGCSHRPVRRKRNNPARGCQYGPKSIRIRDQKGFLCRGKSKGITKNFKIAIRMKKILDACCGSRMCWFDKDNPDTVFMDCRSEEHTLCDGRRLEIRPDVVGDFRKMPFPDNSFYLVLFDPPHLNNLGESSWLAKKYGRLLPSWEDDIRQGFEECMRVLKPNGTLIFKWNEQQIPTARIIEIIGQKPLFGHTSGKGGKTIWMCFLKNEKSNETHL